MQKFLRNHCKNYRTWFLSSVLRYLLISDYLPILLNSNSGFTAVNDTSLTNNSQKRLRNHFEIRIQKHLSHPKQKSRRSFTKFLVLRLLEFHTRTPFLLAVFIHKFVYWLPLRREDKTSELLVIAHPPRIFALVFHLFIYFFSFFIFYPDCGTSEFTGCKFWS